MKLCEKSGLLAIILSRINHYFTPFFLPCTHQTKLLNFQSFFLTIPDPYESGWCSVCFRESADLR